MALADILGEVLNSLILSPELRWSALRVKTEDRFRDELAKALDARTADDVFVAQGISAGGGRRADIAELREGSIQCAIEMKQVWGADPSWRADNNTRAAREAFLGVQPPLRAVVLHEAQRACAVSSKEGIVLLQVVHVETETTRDWRVRRGLSSEAALTRGITAVDNQLLDYLAAAGEARGPFALVSNEVDARTGIRFSIHAMFAAVGPATTARSAQ